VHRVLKAILRASAITWARANWGRRRRARTAPTKVQMVETERWEAAGLHCSANERRADEASRDVEAWLKCRYMRERLGEEFSGSVTAVTSFGVFVTLDALYVEGLVHITELGASTSASTRCARSCAASAPACATPSAPGCASRSAAWIWMGGASTSAWCARARRCAPGAGRKGAGAGRAAAGKKASEELAELEAADRVHKRATKAARSKPGRPRKTEAGR
jgi:ribonuclease R